MLKNRSDERAHRTQQELEIQQDSFPQAIDKLQVTRYQLIAVKHLFRKSCD